MKKEAEDDILNVEEEAAEPEAVVIIEDAEEHGDAQKKYDELFDRLQRTLAEFDNFRKRTQREKACMYDDGVRDALEKLLPVIDNLERALSAADEKENSLYKGVEMIYRQLMTVLDDIGAEILPGVGEPFDPNIHNAVMHVEDPAFGAGEVIEELQRGYMYKDRVIRPSMVKVAN